MLAGCNGYVLSGGYWQNTLSSTQESGVGSDALNIEDDLNAELSEAATEYSIIMGEHSSQRLRISYWTVEAVGARAGGATVSDLTFAGVTFSGLEDLSSTMTVEAASLLWEPSLIKTNFFRLRPIFGLSMMNVNMSIEETTGTQKVMISTPGPEGPLSSVGLEMIPIPVAGACLEVALSPKWFLHAQGQIFDTEVAAEQLEEILPDFSATFKEGTAGLVYIPTRRISVLLGYKHLQVNYTYEQDSSDTIISGPYAALRITLGGGDE